MPGDDQAAIPGAKRPKRLPVPRALLRPHRLCQRVIIVRPNRFVELIGRSAPRGAAQLVEHAVARGPPQIGRHRPRVFGREMRETSKCVERKVKKPFRITAGIVTYRSSWADPFGNPLKKALGELTKNQQIDFGISVDEGYFEVDYTARSRRSTSS